MLEDLSGKQLNFTFPRFARALRHAALTDNRLRLRRKRRPQFVSTVIDFLKRVAKKSPMARAVGRIALRLVHAVRVQIARAGVAIANIPYVQRHTIRHIARMWLSVSGDSAPFVPGRTLAASLWIIEKRIPIITPITRGTVETALLLALGAQMAQAGRAFLYGVGALGDEGADYTASMLIEEISVAMRQLGAPNLDALREFKVRHPGALHF